MITQFLNSLITLTLITLTLALSAPEPPPAPSTDPEAPSEPPSLRVAAVVAAPADEPAPPSSTPGATPGPHPVEALIVELRERFPEHRPGVAIGIVQGQAEPIILTRGVADLSAGTSIGADTPFYIASLGKTFTAAAVLTLAEEGELDLDASIRRYVPHLPEAYQAVTPRLLLGHQGGVPDLFRMLDDEVPEGFTNGDVIRLLEDHGELDFAPGSGIAYSNSGYVLLAEAVREASGMGFGLWMDRHIFRPLGMDAFVVEPGSRIPDGVARGYTLDDAGEFVPADYRIRTTGAGGVYASMQDLVRWDRELQEGRVLSTAVRESMRNAVDFEGGHSPFAPGWIAGEIIQGPLKGKDVQQAFGDLAGFRAGIRRFHEDSLTVIWLSNRGEHLFDLDLAERFLDGGD